MFRLNLGRASRYCDGISRRHFLQLGVAGMAAVGLPRLLRAKEEEVHHRNDGRGEHERGPARAVGLGDEAAKKVVQQVVLLPLKSAPL